MINSPKIIYFFVGSRKLRLNSSENYAKEFFYSFEYFKSKYPKIEIIEFNDVYQYSKLFKKFLYYFDKLLRKLFKFPFFMHELINKQNFTKIINSDILILTNDRIGFSILPIIIIKKLKSRAFLSKNVFVLGLFANLSNNNIQRFFQNRILNFYLSSFDNFLFIGKSEYELAINFSSKHAEKFHYIPFCVDTEFWSSSVNKKNNDILFIGNDGNRDFNMVMNIAKCLKNYKFIFVTNNISKEEISLDNVELVRGHWNQNILTDTQLKEFYERSILTIIPLKNSIQPSGQSVALQSMSMGTPVLISNTIGFWDHEKFKDNENIFFIDKYASNVEWSKKITEIFSDIKNLNKVSNNSKLLIKKFFNLDKFNLEMEKIIKI